MFDDLFTSSNFSSKNLKYSRYLWQKSAFQPFGFSSLSQVQLKIVPRKLILEGENITKEQLISFAPLFDNSKCRISSIESLILYWIMNAN